jgi:transcriptional regulator with XRE-family HTH domain
MSASELSSVLDRQLLLQLGDRLKTLRQAQGLGNVEMAVRAGISRNTLRAIESGDPTTAIGTYVRVMTILGGVPNPPDSFTVSMEVDIYPLQSPELAKKIEGAIGEGSHLHKTHGYYVASPKQLLTLVPSMPLVNEEQRNLRATIRRWANSLGDTGHDIPNT